MHTTIKIDSYKIDNNFCSVPFGFGFGFGLRFGFAFAAILRTHNIAPVWH